MLIGDGIPEGEHMDRRDLGQALLNAYDSTPELQAAKWTFDDPA
jgi:hypothetical protein